MDEDNWNRLSIVAKEKSKDFSLEAHIHHIIDCIKHFKCYSKYINFTPKEYQRTIFDLSFYASELLLGQNKGEIICLIIFKHNILLSSLIQ